VALDVLALGIANHLYWPAANAVVADVLPPSRYEDAYGLLYWQRNAGMAVSFGAGGVLAAYGYGPLFLADAATTLAFAAIAWWRIPETRPAAASGEAAGGGLGAALADRHLVRLVSLNVGFLVVMFQCMVALPVSMAARGLTPAHYGAAMAVNGILILLLQPVAGRLTRDRDDGAVLAVAALLMGAGNGAYALCAAPWQFAAATGLWSLGEILTMPTLSGLVARLAPAELRGRYQGLLSLSFGAGLTLAPAIGGTALGIVGARVFWTGMAGLAAAVAAGHLQAGRARRRAAAATRPA
jgi:MFS family permease